MSFKCNNYISDNKYRYKIYQNGKNYYGKHSTTKCVESCIKQEGKGQVTTLNQLI